MVPFYLPYERPPDPMALWTAIPRGLRGFTVNTALLDAKPVNDDQLLTLNATLPATYAYVFSEIHLTIAQNKAGDWEDRYTLNLQNWYQGQLALASTWNLQFTDGLRSPGTALAIEKSDSPHSMDSMPKAPMWGTNGTTGILITIQAQNESAVVATAGTVNSYIAFWEFDLEQVKKFPINSPTPTHSR